MCVLNLLIHIFWYLFIRNDIIIVNIFIPFIKLQYNITKNVYNNILIFFIFRVATFLLNK